MKLQVLDRIEQYSDWHEIYINGDLVFEGEASERDLKLTVETVLGYLADKVEVDVEIRKFYIDYSPDENEEYSPPLHSMTGETYWEDWERAEKYE